MSDKIAIPTGSIQETLIIPLYGRKLCTELFPDLFSDRSAVELCQRLGQAHEDSSGSSFTYDFSDLEKSKDSFSYQFGALEGAMRGLDMQCEINYYLQKHPRAAIVNLGCGLDQTAEICTGHSQRAYNVDMPDVIEARKQLLPELTSHNIAANLCDHSWMKAIDVRDGVIFFAAGVFHYLSHKEMRELIVAMAERFEGGRLVFDAVGKLGQRIMMRTVLRNFKMNSADDLFYVDKISDIATWSDKIQVSSRGYMLGYNDLRAPGIKPAHRLLARLGDSLFNMQIYRVEFVG